MEKLYRIKNGELYWNLRHSVVPCWGTEGDYFRPNELSEFLRMFKYQRKLWPEGTEIVSYTVGVETPTMLVNRKFAEFNKEITYEKLNGGRH